MYILVSHFEGHWDNVGTSKPSYPRKMIHFDPYKLQSGTESIFIKIDGANRIQRGWKGVIQNIKPSNNNTYFSFALTEELEDAELRRYEGKRSGWYVELSETGVSESREEERLLPKLFTDLKEYEKKDFADFEDSIYIALRLLGIHRAYKFPQEEQAGEADGFFKFLNLAVIYDCTLSDRYEEIKKQQIENYCNQLLQGFVQIPPNILERVTNHQKQVWIITKGRSRILQNVGDVGNVIVKEVSIDDIRRLYLYRLRVGITEDELENLLRNLGQS